MIDTLRWSKKGKWILTAAILVLYAVSLVAWTPDVYRFDYDDYAVQEGDSFQSLLSRDGREPREITNFITHRIIEKRARTYYDLPPEQIENDYTITNADTLTSHPGDRLLANSSLSARDGDHITTEGNTLIISHPGGEYERYQLSTQEDIRMRWMQIGFYVLVVTLVMLLCLSWVWQKPSFGKSKIASLAATLNLIAPEFRRLANGVFRLLVLAGAILATLAAIAAMVEWQLSGMFGWIHPIFAIAALILIPLIVTGMLWIATQIIYVLICGKFIRLSRPWAFLCFLGFYVVIGIGLLPWIV